jgi:hypothetical protein
MTITTQELLQTTKESIYQKRLSDEIVKTKKILQETFEIDDLAIADYLIIREIAKDVLKLRDVEKDGNISEDFEILNCETAIRFISDILGFDFDKPPYNLRYSQILEYAILEDMQTGEVFYFQLSTKSTNEAMVEKLQRDMRDSFLMIEEQGHDWELNWKVDEKILQKIRDQRFYQSVGDVVYYS